MAGIQLISCIRFSMQLFIGESVFVIGCERKDKFLIRLLSGLLTYFVLAFLIFHICSSIPGANPVILILYYGCLFLLTLGLMKWCYSVNLAEILFAGVCGYATQHIAFALITIIQTLTGLSLSVVPDFIFVRVLPYVTVSLLIYFCVIRRYEGRGELKNRDIRMILLALAILFTVVIISVLVDHAMFRGNSSLLQNVFCKVYAIVCSLLAIFIAYYMSVQNRILHENEMMESLLHNMGEQQKLSRETINIINLKCHDLKYRISKIPRIENVDDQQEYINDVKGALEIYDNIYQTGNDALDLVLTEKGLLCNEYNIKLSCMVDGSILGFISTTDVYALFGNLLDNAIECVVKEPDEEKRIISISVSQRNHGNYIHVENYCGEKVVFEDGLPLTTKKETAYHGFGVRSIKYIVEKYRGTLLMREEKKRFYVDIIFYPEQS